MSQPTIGLLMMVAMIIGIFAGFPISFTLLFLGLIFGYWGFGKLVFSGPGAARFEFTPAQAF